VFCARPFNLVGPGEPQRMLTSTLAAQVLAITAGQAPPIVKMRHRATSRDFTDIRDAVRAYWALLERGVNGDVYNVCSGVATPISYVVERLLVLAGVTAQIEETGGGPGRGDVLTQRGSNHKLIAATAWHPEISLDQSLADLLNAWKP
jgi:GDP-4-dehydro-6-deoxy-D-mannose reductase